MKRFFLITLFLIGIIVSPTYALPPGGGAESFVDLDDAPSTYSGQTGKYVRVKVDETGLEFGVPPGGGDMLAATFDADSNDAIDLNRGGTNAALTDPNADRIMFWRDSANAITWLTPGNGLVITTTTLNLDLTPTAGSATLWYNDDALEVKYDGGYFGEGANGLILDLTPSSGSATLQMANDAVVVKYDTTVMDEGANGLTLDLTPSSGSATLIAEEDALQVKYDTTLTEGVNGLGVSNTLTNSHLAANAAIALSKLATGSSAQFIVANGSGVPTYVTMSGDATLSNAGAITIANNKITGTHISLTNEATGDLMNYNAGTGNWEVLAAGTVNYPLVSTGTGAVPGYAQLTAAGIANNTITNSQIANNTIGTTQLAANLAFADGDLIDLSEITPTGGVDEGLILPTYVNVTPASDKPFITFDPSSNSLKVYKGGWVTIGTSGNSGAPTDATYLTVSLDGTLSAERTLSAGLGIGASDGGVNGAYTLTFAPSELGNLTWGTGSAATQAWTFDGSGATDPVLTAGDGYISVTTGELRESTRRVYSVGGTDVAVGDGGTGKSSWTQYGIPYNDTTTSFSQIAIGAGGYYLTVNGGATGYTWAAPLTMDTITDGSSYQKVAAADVNASNHVDRFYDSDGTGYITVTGLSTGRAKTFADVDATVMESGQTYGGLIFGTATPDSAGKIGYASNVVKYHDGTAARTLVAEGRATAGLIFGDADSIPDAAGEIAYNANGVQYYDTGLKTLANLEGAQTITGVKRIADNTNLSFGTDADWSAYYDETTSDNLVISTAKTGAVDIASPMLKILINSGNGTVSDGQNIFEILNYTTSLLKLDENGNVTIPGVITSGASSGSSYISMGGNTGGRDPGSSGTYEIYFDGGTELRYSLGLAEKTVARLEDAQTFTGAKTFTGGIYSGDASTAGSIRIYDGSSNYWTLASPAMSSNYTLTLPVDDGTSGQYLYTDGSGNTAWGNPVATAHGSDTYVQFNDGGSALGSDAGFKYTKATDTLTLGETGAAGKLILADGTYNTTIQQGTNTSSIAGTLPGGGSNFTFATTDLPETISGIKTFSAAPVITALNSIGSRSLNALNLGNGGTIYALDGSDTFRGLYLNYVTNANHSGSSNTIAMIDIAAMTGDAETNLYGLRIGNLTGTTGTAGEVERGISIGTGWDYGIYNSSLTYLGAATTFAGGSDTLTLTTGGSSNYAALSGTVTKLAATSIALGSAYHEPEAIANGSTALRSGQTNTNTVKVQSYDTDGSWADLITGTAGPNPTLALAAAGGITISNTATFSVNPRIYDGNSNYGTFDVPDISSDITYTLPSESSTLAILGANTYTGLQTLGAGLYVNNGATSSGFIRLYEDSDNGSNYLRLIPVASITADTDLLLGQTFTDTKWCSYSTTTGLTCNQDAPAGSGDVTDVGDCTGGACLDGTSDGGTYVRLYDGTSAYESITGGVRTFTFASSTASSENLILTLGNNDNKVYFSSGTGATNLTLTSIGLTTGAASDLSAGNVTLGGVLGTINAGSATSLAFPATLSNAAATTWTVVDNNTSALSIGSTGKADIIKVISTDSGEGVTMSGTLGVGGTISPLTNDGAALGTATYMFSDLFLADGSVINFNNSDVTLTHGSNVLTLAGGNLALGSNSLTMTGSIAATGSRVTKGWFTDIESTNPPTINGGTLAAGALLTGYSSGAGTVTGTDSILQAVQKLNGNIGLAPTLAGTNAFTGQNTIGDAGDDIMINLNVNATDAHWSGTTITRTVKTGSAAEAYGQAMFINSSGELEAADADVGSAAAMPAVCLLIDSGEGASKKCLTSGTITETDWNWTVGAIIYVSANPGTTTGLTSTRPSTSGHFIQRVGVALSADTILVMPSIDVGTAP